MIRKYSLFLFLFFFFFCSIFTLDQSLLHLAGRFRISHFEFGVNAHLEPRAPTNEAFYAQSWLGGCCPCGILELFPPEGISSGPEMKVVPGLASRSGRCFGERKEKKKK